MDYENIYYTCKLPKEDIPLGKYSAKNYRADGASDDAHNVKSDNPDLLKKKIAINRIAKHIIDQNVLTSKDYIVPAPQHTGRAEYTLDIAKIISKETGCKIADVLGCKPRDTLYNLKKKHGAKSIEDSGLYLLTKKFPIWKNKARLTLSDLEKAVNKVKSYAENEWDGYYPTPRVYLSFIDSGALFFGIKGCDADISSFNWPGQPVDVELYFNEKKVGISELKNIFNSLQAEIDAEYDELYLDLDRVEGNKLFFIKRYEERD